MDSAKNWFKKFPIKPRKQPNEKKDIENAKNANKPIGALSTETKQKVAAAKQYIEDHYQSRMKSLQDRRERRWILERKLADADVPEEEQTDILKSFEENETEYMCIQRHKIGADDFEFLTFIGRGAFGEVRLCREKGTGNVYAMKKLKKSEMLRRGQVEHVKAERDLLAKGET